MISTQKYVTTILDFNGKIGMRRLHSQVARVGIRIRTWVIFDCWGDDNGFCLSECLDGLLLV